MGHIINPIYDTSFTSAINLLEETHSLIVSLAISSQKKTDIESSRWGERFKRLEVILPEGNLLIGKESEKFVEIVNILATTERTISALKFFHKNNPKYNVKECHSSTSDNTNGNDIVLVDKLENITIRCEITDVTSSKASQNGKEKKDLKNLGCSEYVPNDTTNRYIATSFEFSNALTSINRKWKTKHYKYIKHPTNFSDKTVLLEIIKNS